MAHMFFRDDFRADFGSDSIRSIPRDFFTDSNGMMIPKSSLRILIITMTSWAICWMIKDIKGDLSFDLSSKIIHEWFGLLHEE